MKKEEILNFQKGQLSLVTVLFKYLFGRRYYKADKTNQKSYNSSHSISVTLSSSW